MRYRYFMAGELTDPRIEAPIFYATDSGMVFLDRNPILFHAVADFCRTEEKPEQKLRHYSTSGEPLRVSESSESWEIGSTENLTNVKTLADIYYMRWAKNVEVEVSTHSTGVRGDEGSLNDDLTLMRRRSLLHQFFYMDAVRNLLLLRREFSLQIPEQLFALETPNGDSLVAQNSTARLGTLEGYLNENDISEKEAERLTRGAVQAVGEKLYGSDLAHGVSGLGRSSSAASYAGNILILPWLKTGEFDPVSSVVGINRQPTTGARGTVGVMAAYYHLNTQGRRYHREPPNP